MLTFEQIKELIELVAARQLQGLEIKRWGFQLKIDGQAVVVSAPPDPHPAHLVDTASAVPAESTATASTPAGATAAEKAGPPPGTHIFPSPIVGTFYRARKAGEPPFVEVSSRVKKGQVLCIIEAMKVMNDITCDADGVIAEIYPQNAQPVEFGEPLFAITPA